MGKYRKKPVVIEAVQFDGTPDSLDEIVRWSDGAVSVGEGRPLIRTLEGTLTIDWNDWIIRGVKGEYYPCKPDIFEQTYDPVDE